MEALDGSLKSWLTNPVIRFKHEHPIGKALTGPDETFVDFMNKAFIVTAYISDKTEKANEAWGLIEDGIIKSFSVGGKVLEKEAIKQGEKQLNKITKMELYEVSVCDIPSNRKSFFSVIAKSLKQEDHWTCPYCDQEFSSKEELEGHKDNCPKKPGQEKAADQDIHKPGAGTHSDKWDRCVEEVRARGGVDSPEAVCTAQLGEESFRGLDRGTWTEKDSKNITELINKINSVNAYAGENPETKENKTEEKICKQNQLQGNLELELRTSLLSKLRQK